MLKTYRALSMAAALAEVKKDLGSDAVIVNTRTTRTGGVLGLGARNVIEITATAGAPRAAGQGGSGAATRASGRATAARSPVLAGVGEAAGSAAYRSVESGRPRVAASAGATAPVGRAAVIAELRPPRSERALERSGERGSRGAGGSEFVQMTPRGLQEAIASQRVERVQVEVGLAPQARVAVASGGAGTVAESRASVATARPSARESSRGTGEGRGGVAVLEAPGEQATAGFGGGASLAVLEGAIPEPVAMPARRLATPAALAPIDGAARAAIDEELASIKRLVAQVLQTSRQTAIRVQASTQGGGGAGAGPTIGGSSEPLMAMSIRLLDAQLSPDLAETLLGHVRDELTPTELADESIVREGVLRHLAKAIPIAPDSTLRRAESGRPLTLALIGPTGVGKTTTVAKLAAALKLRHGKKVGLVTSDTYRIAAVEQLRTYATIIGLPLKVALTPEDMAAACESLGDCDVILVDTAGRSQHDAERLDELRRHRDAAQPHQTHLVLAANMSELVLLRAAERFKALGPDRLLVTKLDEAVAFGPVVNLASRIGLGLSFVTTGQEVPDHIERARADRLARLVVDGGGVR